MTVEARQRHEQAIDDALDNATEDHEMTATEYADLMEDVASRCCTAAQASRDDVLAGRVPE